MKVWVVMVDYWSDKGHRVEVAAVCASPELAKRRVAAVDAGPQSLEEQRGLAWVLEPMDVEDTLLLAEEAARNVAMADEASKRAEQIIADVGRGVVSPDTIRERQGSADEKPKSAPVSDKRRRP